MADLTYFDEDGDLHVEQEIFDEMFPLTDQGERFILIDMYL